jgi:tol-pal system protein YbgF
MKTLAKLLLWAGLSGSVSGCFEHTQTGKRVLADIAAMQTEMAVIKKAHAEEKATLQHRIQEADTKIAELSKLIDDNRQVMGRNVAGVGVDIETMKAQLMELRGAQEVNLHRLDRMESLTAVAAEDIKRLKGQGGDDDKPQIEQKPGIPMNRPEKQDDFYKMAFSMWEKGQYPEARSLFAEFLKKWPKDKYADNALYWVAECFYAENNFREAALNYDKLRQMYPKSEKAPDSLLKLGLCFFEMKKYREAIPFLKEFIQTYPKNPHTATAKKRILEAEKLLRKTKSP